MNPASSTPCQVDIRLVEHLGEVSDRHGEPVTVGIPVPRGLASATDGWLLSSADGNPLPLQARALDRWSDGSVRWALLDFHVPKFDGRVGTVALRFEGAPAASPGPRVTVDREAESISVETGATRFRMSTRAPFIFDEVAGESGILDGARSQLRIVERDGAVCRVAWSSLVVEEAGALRTVVRVDGQAVGRTCCLELTARIHFFAGLPTARLLLTVRNPRRAAHPGGIWELGDPGSVLLREVSLALARPPLDVAERVRWSAEPGQDFRECRERLEIYQGSSGGKNWRSRNHVNRTGEVPLRFRGYRVEADGVATTGLRATPVVVTEGQGGSLGAVFPEFWQNFPRAIDATPTGVTLGLFPRQYDDLHELQGGEQKTHEVFLLFGRGAGDDPSLEWCRSRLLAHASPEWYAASGAVPFLTPASEDPSGEYLALVNTAIEGTETFLQKRERQDEYGWRNFGDVVADHEATLSADPAGFVSHYNNQYDAVNGLGVHFLRTADPRWWEQMDQLARHVVDIDIYHMDQDKAAYNHGLFWHTTHYVDAGRSTHRCYPRVEGVCGGGPSNEHDYSSGLMLHHFLTGDAASREAVVELAGWVIDMDDGRKTVFRLLDRGATGLASQTGSPLYHGPGRGPANSITTLLNAHVLTGERGYLDKAGALIRRCVHPRDDIEALNLLDAETRWYYNVFLQALGRYLWMKAERGENDAAYGYAQESLLHYARWMADYEYPYLEKPEILEYPNETWPAQDMRKSEVFMLAALHADGHERGRFEERAEHFFDYSVRTLLGMPSHTLTRPTVLMLVNGFMRSWYRRHPSLRLPAPLSPVPASSRPVAFVPQKIRAIRRAKLILALGASACLVGLLLRFLGGIG